MADDDVDALFESDSEEDEDFDPSAAEKGDSAPQRETAAELSDDGDDEDADPEPDRRETPDTAIKRFRDAEERPSDLGLDDSDDDGVVREASPPAQELGPPLELSAPFVPRPDANTLWLARTSNIMNIEMRPFDPATFEREGESYIDEASGEVKVRLKDANTIRWRAKDNPDGGEPQYESNARFVRWSDGSLQLLLGDEVLDTTEQDMSMDHHYLFVRHQGLIQGQAQLRTKMAFRPASLLSKSHRQLTAALDKRHVKVNRVQPTVTVLDPKKAKADREREEEGRIKSREGLARKQEKAMRKFARPAPARGGLSAAYLEADMDEEDDYADDLGMTPTERARQSLTRPRRVDEAAEAEAERRLASAKRDAPPSGRTPALKRSRPGVISSDEEDEMADFIENDLSDDDAPRTDVKKAKPGRRQINLSDSDEE